MSFAKELKRCHPALYALLGIFNDSFSFTENSVLFETPYTLCDTFRGREDALSHIEEYFYPLGGNEDAQLSFAICGLGKRVIGP